MSLISTLNQIIKDRNGEIVTYNEIKAYCEKAHYKLSNAERRLRPSDSPNIERVMKNGAIIGYKWQQSGDIAPIINKADVYKRDNLSSDCCPSSKIFKDNQGNPIHAKNCVTNKQTQGVLL